jgi:hypothetical protein
VKGERDSLTKSEIDGYSIERNYEGIEIEGKEKKNKREPWNYR